MVGTSEKIFRAARRVLDEEGARAISIRGVAEAVGITPMAVYRHYHDRAALLNALADAGFAELAGTLAKKDARGTPEERLLRALEIYLDFSLRNPRLFELMFLEKREGARQFPADFGEGKSPTANLVAEIVADGIRTGHFREDDVWEITFSLGAHAHGLTLLYLGGRIEASPTRFRALYRRSFRRILDGLRA
ncbi:MAG: TetR/AcrR family transcriptional regulator [Acidobacteria bacterium]|nr:TetR/AcrR family transcriptional regulator [Acidobacteriota bacterium]